ncbi:MAG: MMPL family transporter, partial [Myxococcota bacterium]
RKAGGGGSTILVMVESPDANANRKVIDQLEAQLKAEVGDRVESIEHGPEETRAFFAEWKWLFARERDLALVACEVHRERLRRLGQYLDLDDPCEEEVGEDIPAPDAIEKRRTGEVKPAGYPAPPPISPEERAKQAAKEKERSELPPLTRLKRELEDREAEVNPYPTGYYRNPEGTLYAILVRSASAGMGEFGADSLLNRVQAAVDSVDEKAFHPEAEVGLGGDIPNAIAERNALIEDMTLVTGLAVFLVLGSIVVFFRSGWPLIHIGLAVGTGCGIAFGTAALVVGQLNAATSFLGSIIVGNGINDSIVYLGRYRECRSQGATVEDALVEAATSTRIGTWLASVAAGGAYGALMVTSFRGFSEFGLIGLVGMIACWFATYLFVPASVTLVERRRAKKKVDRGEERAMRNALIRWVARASSNRAAPVLVVGVALAAVAAWPLPAYLQNPWEYDFNRLRSRSSGRGGAGKWSAKAGQLFKSRGAPELLLAPSREQAGEVAREVIRRDDVVTGGKFVERVAFIDDRLGGDPATLKRKLALLDEIRTELDQVKDRLEGEDREFARDWRPPERLRLLEPKDLPSLVQLQYAEEDGTLGTPVYVYFNRHISKSRGENLLQMADVLESVEVPEGEVVPNASRATVFAEMIRSMERDGPRATLAAFLVVILVSIVVTRAWRPTLAVVGSLVLGVLLTVGGAAWLGVRLNFLNFVALPLTFGIGVEYAINLYDRIRVKGGDVVEGIASAGSAVFLCSLTTIIGYGSLLWADNLALRSFGLYAVAGEVACILTGLVVLPAALSLRRSAPRGSPAPANDEASA